MKKKNKRQCPHCDKDMTAYKEMRRNYPYGTESSPRHTFRRVKFMCFNKKCKYKVKHERYYKEYSRFEKDYYHEPKSYGGD